MTIALVCARAGSKGIPGKNIKTFGGKPLIVWAIEHALTIGRVERVIVSTDSEEIAEVARTAGADVPFLRPAELARDDSPEWEVWRHALRYLEQAGGALPKALLVVPVTSPLRLPEDLDRCLDEFEKGDADVVITVTEARRSPYFNMVTVGPEGMSTLVMPGNGPITRRQDAPHVYEMATVAYVARPEFVMQKSGLFSGRVRQVVIAPERAVDIDTPLDFRIAECLLHEREGKNEKA